MSGFGGDKTDVFKLCWESVFGLISRSFVSAKLHKKAVDFLQVDQGRFLTNLVGKTAAEIGRVIVLSFGSSQAAKTGEFSANMTTDAVVDLFFFDRTFSFFELRTLIK